MTATLRKYGLGGALAALAVLGVGAGQMQCATLGQELVRFGSDLVSGCGANALAGYYDFRNALHDGGLSWVSFALGDAAPCIEHVIADELKQHGCSVDSLAIHCSPTATQVASSAPAITVVPARPGEIRRACLFMKMIHGPTYSCPAEAAAAVPK